MNPESPLLQGLNPSQKEAVIWRDSPLLIIAGAGSGKTRILVHRIAHLIAQGVPGFHILGVTFTNKAAGEMRQRVQRLVQQEVWVSTFHSTCLKILRMDGAHIGLDRNFTIYDDSDQRVLIKECLADLKMNEKQLHPKGILERIQRAKDGLLTSAQYIEKSQDLYDEAVGKVYELYEKKLAHLKALDFGDLIMKTVKLFDSSPAVLAGWQNRFQHILIDEYQDTNHAQYRLVRQWADAKKQITVVGDPDQSIYSWRGADIQNILRFENDYPNCGIIKLERNYRSTATILDAANELIRHNTLRKPKNLWTERVDGEKISLFEAWDEKQEAEFVVSKVLHHASQGRKMAEQVVFYRVHAQSRILEDSLRRSGIPYKIIGGVRFYDRKEIKDLVAYLRVLVNPSDDLSLKRILNVPTRGIGKKALQELEDLAVQKKVSLYDAVAQHAPQAKLTPKALRALQGFVQIMESLRKRVSNTEVAEITEGILERSGYLEALREEKTIEAKARLENIQEFFSVIQDFEDMKARAPKEEEPQSPLAAFLESITLLTDLDRMQDGTNVLTLMSLHTAKGLEFPIVYMIGLEEGIFPNINSMTDSLDDLEEERRLCYVGMTRAQDKLFMSYARERRLYGSQQRNLPSRFLMEIPSGLFESRPEVMGVSDSESYYDIDDLDVPAEDLQRLPADDEIFE